LASVRCRRLSARPLEQVPLQNCVTFFPRGAATLSFPGHSAAILRTRLTVRSWHPDPHLHDDEGVGSSSPSHPPALLRRAGPQAHDEGVGSSSPSHPASTLPTAWSMRGAR